MTITGSYRKWLGDVVAYTMNGNRRATKYVSPSFTIKATRQHKYRPGALSGTVIVTLGRPNYAEREFIKKAKKAGEPFPVRKGQLREWK